MPSTDVDLSQDTNSIFLPFIHRYGVEGAPQVMCTVDGVSLPMPIDTGSTGLLIGAPILPNIDPEAGEPAHHFFTSSRILYVGRVVELCVGFDGEAGSYATSTVPVLIVDKSWTCPWYNPMKDKFVCPPGPHGEKATERDTSRITYMGIGFGRNRPRDGMPLAGPRANPFLNIDAINGHYVSPSSVRAGYIVSTQGVEIGLTAENTRGFAFENLEPGLTHKRDPRDWAMARMSFSINGEGRYYGPALIDTGIAQMYIRCEDSSAIPSITIRNPNKHGYAKMVKRVKPGTRIAVGFPSLDGSAPSYSFVVGEGSPIEPKYVVPGKAATPPYVNTGRNLLYGYSIAFDAIGGRFGLRQVNASSSAFL